MSFLKKLFKPKADKVPHVCFTCKYFQMREQKPHNKGCRYPGKIKVVGGFHGVCQMWELQPDPEKRQGTFF